ncbi:hypothetical protein BDZ89DRAFT_1135286 [Hymenopellis radicata]|nr:hypothetical protein BDZ89DRAFT_1135286 [Hymenopellis radicata]
MLSPTSPNSAKSTWPRRLHPALAGATPSMMPMKEDDVAHANEDDDAHKDNENEDLGDAVDDANLDR